MLRCTDYLVSMEEFNICKCRQCDFIFTADYPDASEAGRYYESPEYISHSDSRRTLTDRAYQFARKIMLRRKRRMVIETTGLAKGNVLDIGSGTGHFLNVMKEAGWDITGIEINKSAREYAASQFSLKVLPPEELKALPSEEFDCITLWHVAEHLYDLNRYFNEIKRLLKPDGIVLVALPNSYSFDSAHFGKFWAAYDVPRHLWHFNYMTFPDFASKAEFTISSIRPLPLDVFYISILSEKHKKNPAPFITGIIKGAYFSMLSIFNRLKSSSLVFVLKRKIDQ